MQLIPSLVLQSMANPKHIQQLFISYIQKADLTITNSKTISGIAYYHKKAFTVGSTSAKFFTQPYVAEETNISGGSFIRPESEHLLIWAIRVETNITSLRGSTWTPGVATSAFMYNTQMTITTNSEVKYKKYPLSEALSDLTTRDNGLIPLPEPVFWAGQQEFVVDVENGENIVAPASQFMKLTLIGLGLI